MSPAPRFGYVPYSDDLTSPGDRRRFVWWAKERGIDWEVHRPGVSYDVVYLASTADITTWRHHPNDGTRIVYELIDSYLDVGRTSLKGLLRGVAKVASGELRRPVLSYEAALRDMISRADTVVCSTEEQRRRLLPSNDDIHPILDAHFDVISRVKDDFSTGDVINLVWEGLPYTLDDVETVLPALRALERDHPLALHLVTDLTYHRYAKRFVRASASDIAAKLLPRTYLYQWNDQLLDAIVTACDVAIIPLDTNDPLALGKPENKLLLFWRAGMPAVTSRTPAYERAMAGAGLDLTCATTDDWIATLDALLRDEPRRRAAADAGRAFVDREHSRTALLERWDRALLRDD